jgi:formylglycine-generating enzyme required for sulfatase activity
MNYQNLVKTALLFCFVAARLACMAGAETAQTADQLKGTTTEQAESKAPTPKAELKTGQGQTFTLPGGIPLEMVYIAPGTFMMGSPGSEPNHQSDETQHQVTLTKGFWLGKYEVTQGQWKAVMGSNPSNFSSCGSSCPVEQVSWNDCQEFIRKLNNLSGFSGFRLPTEAEWEYACRAGTTTAFYTGAITETGRDRKDPNLDVAGWYGYNSGDRSGWHSDWKDNNHGTKRVGLKKPNAWGLYDMHGNVWEWCADWYGDYPSGSVNDPKGPSTGSYRVLRGGSWDGSAGYCRSADRGRGTPARRSLSLGFRLCRTN